VWQSIVNLAWGGGGGWRLKIGGVDQVKGPDNRFNAPYNWINGLMIGKMDPYNRIHESCTQINGPIMGKMAPHNRIDAPKVA
jgi:hypothetical protein